MKKASLAGRGRAWAVVALWGGLSLAHAQTPPTITCGGDNAAVLNTGVSTTGNVDNRWRYQGLAAYAGASPANWNATFGDAWVTSSSQWAAAPTTGDWRWIGANSSGLQPVIPGNPNAYGNIDALFRIDFTLDASVNPADFAPTMKFLADNSVVDIMVNGQWQGPNRPGGALWSGLPQAGTANQFNYNGFGADWRGVTIAMASPDWQAGANTMVVYVKSSVPLMGFGAYLMSNNVCPNNQAPTAVPTLSGSTGVGSVVSGSYVYGDANSDVEDASASGSTFRLVRSSDATLTPTSPMTVLASGAAGGGGVSHALYTLQASDVGEYLYYCVTPAAQTGTSPGEEACTSAFGPVTLQTPTAVPTLSGWALMLLGTLLGWVAIRRRPV